MRLFGAPDGAAYVFRYRQQEAPELYGSDDGGQTWRDLGRVEATWPEDAPPPGVPSWVPPGGPWEAWPFGSSQFAFGPDGRLYAGGVPAQQVDYHHPGGGVLRTVEPVVAVAAEPAAPAAPETLGVLVYPNPSGEAVTVELAGVASGTAVRVVVYDGLGREVTVLHDGPAAPGGRFSVEVGALQPGPYVVRIVSGSATAAAPFTVVR